MNLKISQPYDYQEKYIVMVFFSDPIDDDPLELYNKSIDFNNESEVIEFLTDLEKTGNLNKLFDDKDVDYKYNHYYVRFSHKDGRISMVEVIK